MGNKEKINNIFRISWDMGYSQALNDLIDELEITNCDDNDTVKIKYIFQAMARLLM